MLGADRLAHTFERPLSAIGTTIAALFGVALVYVLVHMMRTPPELPWDKAVVFCPEKHDPDHPQAGVGEADGFQVEFHEEYLVKYFTKSQIQDLKARIEKDVERYTAEDREWRRSTVARLAVCLEQNFPDHPLRGIKESVPNDRKAAIDLIDTRALSALLAFVNDKLEHGNISQSLRDELRPFVADLEQRIAVEKCQRELLTSLVKALEPSLSFHWLYHEDSGWVFEIVSWTILGVLANTLIALIGASRSAKYSPNEFLLFLPKLCLAPVLSVVIVALISSGFTDYGVTAINLPWLLVLGFMLGFGTESLYTKIREVTTTVIGKTSLSEARLDDARRPALLELARAVPVVDPAGLPPARNRMELKDNLASVLKSKILGELVPVMAKKATKPQ